MKKYHHSPTFGVRSGRRRGVPYVDHKNCVDPVIIIEAYSKAPIVAANPATCETVNLTGFGDNF